MIQNALSLLHLCCDRLFINICSPITVHVLNVLSCTRNNITHCALYNINKIPQSVAEPAIAVGTHRGRPQERSGQGARRPRLMVAAPDGHTRLQPYYTRRYNPVRGRGINYVRETSRVVRVVSPVPDVQYRIGSSVVRAHTHGRIFERRINASNPSSESKTWEKTKNYDRAYHSHKRSELFEISGAPVCILRCLQILFVTFKIRKTISYRITRCITVHSASRRNPGTNSNT